MSMREDIIANIDNPKELEKLYRLSRSSFKTEFNSVYPELKNYKFADFWNERLNYEGADISLGTKGELTFLIIAALLAAAIVKIPAYLPVSEEFFYTRNLGFVFFPILMMYFSWKNKLPLKKFAIVAVAVLFSLAFINMLPDNNKSDTLKLSCIHLPLFLWSVLGFTFTGDKLRSY